MASSNTTPDTPITLKVNFEGLTRKFKLPLRDLGANTLPDKLRSLLDVPAQQDVILERYSDSAASFVVLDPSNVSVYKQLYRAAKAKQKLRIKATVVEQPKETVAEPATVEDESTAEAKEQLEPRSYTTHAGYSASPPLLHPFNVTIPSVADLRREFEHLVMQDQPVSSCTQIGSEVPSTPTRIGPYPAIPSRFDSDLTLTQIPSAAESQWAAFPNTSSSQRNSSPPVEPPCSLPSPTALTTFSVYCNNCKDTIPDVHYHCSTCDDGDYDLCETCVDNGISCNGDDHWMIKRFVQNGKVINSTTETLAPKPTPVAKESIFEVEEPAMVPSRTCNSCIQEFTEEKFVTCLDCDDYDLCLACHIEVQHGHNPKHRFAPAVSETKLGPLGEALLAPGRNVGQHAICDGCDKYIYGVRHKCLDCPDWDYCSSCYLNIAFIHPGHRFVPVYEPLGEINPTARAFEHKIRHIGICCDGPLCNKGRKSSSYIRGDRYKCAVCHDTDFCASCEASPENHHNKTHPLIKFKTPVRNVCVTTLGEHDNGQRMPVLGDRFPRPSSTSKATETTPTESSNAATQVQTVAEVEPTDDVKSVASEPEVTEKKEKLEVTVEKTIEVFEQPAIKEEETAPKEEELLAHFVRDTIADGTVLPPNCVFEQTWVLRNVGNAPWPAGCSVKFVGGDNMLAVDSAHPASVHELVSAAESTVCYTEVAAGQERAFTVLMRTPTRPGKAISYWRLTGPSGLKFGHKLWCDITVSEPALPPLSKFEDEEKEVEQLGQPEEPEVKEEEKSQVIFPKLEKESPVNSVHEEPQLTPEAPKSHTEDEDDLLEDVEDVSLGDDETEDGFFTDDEYDILDASDHEYLAEQAKAVRK